MLTSKYHNFDIRYHKNINKYASKIFYLKNIIILIYNIITLILDIIIFLKLASKDILSIEYYNFNIQYHNLDI